MLRLWRVPLLGRAPPLDARGGVALAALVLAPHSAAPVLGLLGVDAIVVRPADQAGVGRGRAGLLPADGQAFALPGRENNKRENVVMCGTAESNILKDLLSEGKCCQMKFLCMKHKNRSVLLHYLYFHSLCLFAEAACCLPRWTLPYGLCVQPETHVPPLVLPHVWLHGLPLLPAPLHLPQARVPLATGGHGLAEVVQLVALLAEEGVLKVHLERKEGKRKQGN